MRSFADLLKDVAEASRDDALKVRIIRLANHRVRLTAASLAIGKDCTIIALKNVFDQRKRRFAVHQGLFWSLIEDGIIGETLDIIYFFGFG